MPSEPSNQRSANALSDLAMKYAGEVPTRVREVNEALPTAAVDAGKAIFSKLPPELQERLSEAASAGGDALHQMVSHVASSPAGQAIGAGFQGIDAATKPLQERYAASQQMMKDMGVQTPSMVDNPLFDVADVGPIGSAGSTILYRGRQIGQNEAGKATWWTPSEEMATKFSQHVRGKKKPVNTGEVVSETLGPDVKVVDTSRDVVSYPTYAEVSKELGVPYEELEDVIKKAPDHSNASVIAPDIGPDKQIRFHFLIEIPEVQELLRRKGFTHIKAKERISKDEYASTYLNIRKKGVKEESKLMARPQMAMRAPDVPKTSKNIPITQSDPIINTAGSYDLLESTTPTGWSVYPVKRGTKIPNFKNEVEAQTAIDAYETQLIAKHGEDEVLQFPIATYTGGFADLELPATKMSTEEISTLRAMHHARNMFSQRDMQNAQNVIKSRISAVDPETVKNVSPLFDGLLKRKALDEAMGRKPNISESEYRSVVADAYSRLAEKKWPGAYDLHDIDNAEMLWHNGVAGTDPTPLINKAQDIVNSVFRGELPAAKAISSGKAKGGPVKRYAKGDLVSMYNDYHDTSFKDRARATLNNKHK